MRRVSSPSSAKAKRRTSLALTQSLTDTYREAMRALGLKRYCCRRMVLGRTDVIEKLLNGEKPSSFEPSAS